MAQFLWTSLLASAVLTIVLNLALRLVPGLGDRLGRWLASLAPRPPQAEDLDLDDPDLRPTDVSRRPEPGRPRVQVYVPWKAMLIGSVVLTVLLNLPRLL